MRYLKALRNTLSYKWGFTKAVLNSEKGHMDRSPKWFYVLKLIVCFWIDRFADTDDFGIAIYYVWLDTDYYGEKTWEVHAVGEGYLSGWWYTSYIT